MWKEIESIYAYIYDIYIYSEYLDIPTCPYERRNILCYLCIIYKIYIFIYISDTLYILFYILYKKIKKKTYIYYILFKKKIKKKNKIYKIYYIL